MAVSNYYHLCEVKPLAKIVCMPYYMCYFIIETITLTFPGLLRLYFMVVLYNTAFNESKVATNTFVTSRNSYHRSEINGCCVYSYVSRTRRAYHFSFINAGMFL